MRDSGIHWVFGSGSLVESGTRVPGGLGHTSISSTNSTVVLGALGKISVASAWRASVKARPFSVRYSSYLFLLLPGNDDGSYSRKFFHQIENVLMDPNQFCFRLDVKISVAYFFIIVVGIELFDCRFRPPIIGCNLMNNFINFILQFSNLLFFKILDVSSFLLKFVSNFLKLFSIFFFRLLELSSI